MKISLKLKKYKFDFGNEIQISVEKMWLFLKWRKALSYLDSDKTLVKACPLDLRGKFSHGKFSLIMLM